MDKDQHKNETVNVGGVLQDLFFGRDLSRDESFRLWTHLISGSATDAQLGAILAAFSSKGETADEIAGGALALLAAENNSGKRDAGYVEISGTPANGGGAFTIRTASAFVIAATGVRVAQQVVSASNHDGHKSLLEELGVRISFSAEEARESLAAHGICFVCPYVYETARRRLAAVRDELGAPTVLNLIEPLANPALPSFQVIGVWHPEVIKPVARAVRVLGSRRSLVVHNLNGSDQIAFADKTLVAEVDDGNVRTFEIGREEFGLGRAEQAKPRNGDLEYNAQLIGAVLAGQRRDEVRSAVVINAASGLLVAGAARRPRAAARMAEDSIDSGRARQKLEEARRSTRSRHDARFTKSR